MAQGEKASLAKQNQKQESAAAAATASQAFAGQPSGGALPYGSSAAAPGDPTVRVQRWSRHQSCGQGWFIIRLGYGSHRKFRRDPEVHCVVVKAEHILCLKAMVAS